MPSRACRGRRCRAPIRWVRYPTGKAAPIDPEPHPDGRVKLTGTEVDGYTPAVVLGDLEQYGAREAGDPLYMPHHATCPDVDGFRR